MTSRSASLPPVSYSRRQTAWVWGLGVLVTLLAGWGLQTVVGIEQARRQAAEQLALQTRVASVRARLESELNATLSLSLGVSSFVLSRPDFTAQDMNQVAASLIRAQPAIRSVAVAPDNVIRYIYPLAANRAALGLRYMDTPAQRDAVLRLMREKRPIVAGPIELVQGGQGLVNRIPVIFSDAGVERYWGLVSLAIDPQPVFARAGLFESGLQFALRGRDGRGEAGEVFLGDAALFRAPQARVMDVVIPGGRWQLAARPALPLAGAAPLGQALIAALALAFGALTAIAVRSHQRNRNLALCDSLTGLANRRHFMQRGAQRIAQAQRTQRPMTLLNLDIDGFKQINDTYGHAQGDRALRKLASQLRTAFAEPALLARIGGDEFLALLPDTAPDAALAARIGRLREALATCPSTGTSGAPNAIRLSIGVAHLDPTHDTLDALLREADRAMYADKRARRPTTGDTHGL